MIGKEPRIGRDQGEGSDRGMARRIPGDLLAWISVLISTGLLARSSATTPPSWSADLYLPLPSVQHLISPSPLPVTVFFVVLRLGIEVSVAAVGSDRK